MAQSAPSPDSRWDPLTPSDLGDIFATTDARWWLSGGVALDRWLGAAVRERRNTDVSTTTADLPRLLDGLPATLTAWVPAGESDEAGESVVPWADAPDDADLQPVRIYDPARAAWVLQVNVEDGSERAWIYRRDPRLQLPWDRAVQDIDGIPTGAPEVQLLWKALRPRPEDDADKDAVLPTLSEDARRWWERALLSIHPHSSWAIHVRSPMFPAKASWNRPTR